ncbi:DUF2637 domain-containing protein [Micromonospora sp. WMMD967]|uniref:DUF2637 domain-containing protein n=1 Tax=Micromonospora sp. WMMD967 TaxID=3016101 RepID=UPI002417128B|nr:DUF2637 domain-containing protein [Micromonospora sp. WMMD967]MDG4838300.1 DUF2637 domain-containing protein [Micromonospora sp. WMMD967]
MDIRLVLVGIAVAIAVTAIDVVLRRTARPVGPGRSLTDLVITTAATLTTLGLAGVAGAVSYDHLRELAESRGEQGWKAHAFPLTVDGIEVVATLAILADRRAGRPSGAFPWIALTAGGVVSLGANILIAEDDVIARIIAGWPAVALIAAIKMLSRMLEHPTANPVQRDEKPEPQASGQRYHTEPEIAGRAPDDDNRPDDVSRHDPDVSRDDPDTSRHDGDDLAPGEDLEQPWPVDLIRRIPVNADRYRRWQAVWADMKDGETDLRALAQRHNFDVRSVQAIRRAGQVGMLDHPVPIARRLAELAPHNGSHDNLTEVPAAPSTPGP